MDAEGLLRIEFSEGVKQLPTSEGEWQCVSGKLTFEVSAAAVAEPASAALLRR